MRYVFAAFLCVCVAHLGEHLAQAIQVYALGTPLHDAGGILGLFYPWLVHSEVLHYGYAALMLAGLFVFRNRFTGAGRWWWSLALGIQSWHHFEHALLLWQASTGHNFFGAPQPISVIQLTGFLYGTPSDGFGGLLTMSHFGVCTCPGAAPGTIHRFSPALLTVRRLEVHLHYNFLVAIPMVVAMFRGRQSRSEAARLPQRSTSSPLACRTVSRQNGLATADLEMAKRGAVP